MRTRRSQRRDRRGFSPRSHLTIPKPGFETCCRIMHFTKSNRHGAYVQAAGLSTKKAAIVKNERLFTAAEIAAPAPAVWS